MFSNQLTLLFHLLLYSLFQIGTTCPGSNSAQKSFLNNEKLANPWGGSNSNDTIVQNFEQETGSYFFEREILIEFYKATSLNSRWLTSTGWLLAFSDHCQWFGITCETKQSSLNSSLKRELNQGKEVEEMFWSVVEINLSSNQLSGSLPSVLFMLQNLEVLDVSQNKLFGSVPSLKLSSSSLKFFDVSSNVLSSFQDNEINYHQFKVFDISENKFTSLPLNSEAPMSPGLEILKLGKNRVNQLPSGFSSLSWSLRVLDLSFNPKLGLGLGSEIWSLNKLEMLDLTNIGLRSLNSGIESLTSLMNLELSWNQLHDIENIEWDKLEKLKYLWIDQNLLKSLPTFSGLTNLVVLSGSYNPLEGKIQISSPNLSYLFLIGNEFPELDISPRTLR